MTRRPAAARRGITLTEVLISILIMGVGVISLATLFPLGMVRLREASRQNRSGLLGESATADLTAMGLLYKPSFTLSWYGALSPYAVGAYDPFTQDPLPSALPAGVGLVAPITLSTGAVYSFSALPVCYDPLWWSVAGSAPTAALTSGEYRFGQGVFTKPTANLFLRADPADSGTPAGHGLQRITNFASVAGWALNNPSAVFVSPDDFVMQNADAPPQVIGTTNTTLSGVLPQMSGNAPLNDWRYTWLFTGSQTDASNGTVFVGNVVVMDGRPLAIDSVVSPTSATASATASGEIVMEAIFGYSANVVGGFGVAADRIVLLRWPSAMPDPEIKVGSWVADVTYQRDPSRIQSLVTAGSIPLGHPLQRCHWYQVSKKNEVQADPDVAGYRRLVVTVNTPVKDRTLLASGGKSVVVNVALFMPSVVNVFQRTVFVRTDN